MSEAIFFVVAMIISMAAGFIIGAYYTQYKLSKPISPNVKSKQDPEHFNPWERDPNWWKNAKDEEDQ